MNWDAAPAGWCGGPLAKCPTGDATSSAYKRE